MSRIELELRIRSISGKYHASVQDRFGAASVEFAPAPEFLAEVGSNNHIRNIKLRHQNRHEGALGELLRLGRSLFDLVFRDRLLTVFERSLAAARENDWWFHLRLCFEGPLDCADWPWEALVDSNAKVLALQPNFSIERRAWLDRAIEPPELPTERELRLLVAGASPRELVPIDVAGEQRWIRQALADSAVNIETTDLTDRKALDTALAGGERFDLIHVIAHGDFENHEGSLMLHESTAGSARLSSRELPAYLRGAVPFVFLNACHGARNVSPGELGLAEALLRSGAHAVVAMRREITDAGAVELSRAFYEGLARGESLAQALARARRQVPLDGLDWAVPVLLLSGADFSIFHEPSMRSPLTSATPASAAPVRRLGIFRSWLDRHWPGLHRRLIEARWFDPLPDEALFQGYLKSFGRKMEQDNQPDSIVPRNVGEVVRISAFGGEYRKALPRAHAVRTVRRVLKELVGPAGGETITAPLATATRKGRVIQDAVGELENSPDPVVLLGDPGSGKSVILRQVAYQIAQREQLRAEPLIPVYIRLGRFRKLSGDPIRSVQKLIEEELEAESPELAGRVEELSRQRRLVAIFDGLDEMDRRNYSGLVRALSEYARRHRGLVKTIFSCRINDFSPEFEHRQIVLVNLDQDQTLQFLKLNLSWPVEVDGEDCGPREVLKILASQEWLEDSARNPLLLHLICEFIEERRRLPEGRAELFDSYLEVLEERPRVCSRPPEASAIAAAAEDWARLAFELLHQRGGTYADPGLIAATVDESRMEEMLRLGQVAGVLIADPAAEGAVRFVHHRIQEYLAARHLASIQEEPDWRALLDYPRWQETLLHLVSLGRGAQALEILKNMLVEEKPPKATADDREADVQEVSAQDDIASDRVVLASLVIREANEDPTRLPPDFKSKLLLTLRHLADTGNPVTQVKMLWASSNLKSVPLLELLGTPLESKIRWVRDQALLVMSSANRGVSEFADELAYDLTNEELLPRLPIYWKWLRKSPGLKYSLLLAFAALLAFSTLVIQLAGIVASFAWVDQEFGKNFVLGESWLAISGVLTTIVAMVWIAPGFLRHSWDKNFISAAISAGLLACVSIGISHTLSYTLAAVLLISVTVLLIGQVAGIVTYGAASLTFLGVHLVVRGSPAKAWLSVKRTFGQLEWAFPGSMLLAVIASPIWLSNRAGCWIFFVASIGFVFLFTLVGIWRDSLVLATASASLGAGGILLVSSVATDSVRWESGTGAPEIEKGFSAAVALLVSLLEMANVAERTLAAVVGVLLMIVAVYGLWSGFRERLAAEGSVHRSGANVLWQVLLAVILGIGLFIVCAAVPAAAFGWIDLTNWKNLSIAIALVALLGMVLLANVVKQDEIGTSAAVFLGLVFLGLLSLTFIIANRSSDSSGAGRFLIWFVLLRILIPQLYAAAKQLKPWMFHKKKGRYPTDWQQAIRSANPLVQSMLLRDLPTQTRESGPSDMLKQLIELESAIEEEPAKGVYWQKRFDLQEILRQRHMKMEDPADTGPTERSRGDGG